MSDEELGNEIRALIERSGRADVQIIACYQKDGEVKAKSYGASPISGQWRWVPNAPKGRDTRLGNAEAVDPLFWQQLREGSQES